MMTRWIHGAFVLIASVALAQVAQAEQDKLAVGQEAKNFTLKVLNPDEVGERYVGIDRYYGAEAKEPKKAILLTFFATYCEPCKREMPFLAALYNLYQDKGLMVMSISIDKEAEKIEEVTALAKENKVSFPVLSDRFNIVAKRYLISKLPCIYLLDSNGKIAMVNVGYNDDISKDLLDSIRKAIGESVSDPVPDELARYMHGNEAGKSSVQVSSDEAADAESNLAAEDADGAEEQAAEADAGADEAAVTKAKTKAKRKRKGKRNRRRRRRR